MYTDYYHVRISDSLLWSPVETDYFSFIQDNDPAVLSLEEIKACLEELETEKVGNVKNVKKTSIL